MEELKIKAFALILTNGNKYVCRSSKGFENLGDIAKIFRDAAEVSQVNVEKATIEG